MCITLIVVWLCHFTLLDCTTFITFGSKLLVLSVQGLAIVQVFQINKVGVQSACVIVYLVLLWLSGMNYIALLN